VRHVRYRPGLVATCVAALAVSGAGAAQAAAQSRVVLVGTGFQTGYGLTDAGPSDPGITATDHVYLNVRDPAALAERARSVSTPGSPDYERFSTPGQIQAQNQLTTAELDRVRGWLTSAGLSVTLTNWRELSFTGTIGQLQSAFDVTFDNYTDSDPTDPDDWEIPTTDLSVPGDVGSLVLDVTSNMFPVPISSAGSVHAEDGVSNGSAGTGVYRPAKLGGVSLLNTASDSSSASSTCSRYWGEKPATGMPEVDGRTPSLAPCGYTPTQLRQAYGLDGPTATGAGQTVAVVMPAMDTLEQDVDTWSAHVGTQTLRPGQLTVVPTPDGTPAATPAEAYSLMVENTLDVEAVHGMAPDADIISLGFSTADDGSDLDSLTYAIDHTHASIVSLSFTFDTLPGLQTGYDEVYQEGALRGVGFYYASGDGGHDPTGNFLTPQAGDEWVTGVGGTSLGIGPDGSREWETGWGDGSSALSPDGTSWEPPQNGGGSGGGWVVGQPRPWYQQGVVSDREATGEDGKVDRTGPDVAMDADAATGMLVGGTPLYALTSPTSDPSTWQYTERRIGGTSLSTPLFAGVQALAQQARGGQPFGFANPTLYRLADTGAFRDITPLTGAPPATVVQNQISTDGFAPYLTQMFGQVPSTPFVPTTPEVGPGFDTETGIGVPTGAYLSWGCPVISHPLGLCGH
jgi:subtilase family serine protease